MKTKIILAAISVPLLIGAIQTPAFASTCSLSGSNVTCDSFDLDTAGEAVVAITADRPNVYNNAIATYSSLWISTIQAIIAANPANGSSIYLPTNEASESRYIQNYTMSVPSTKVVSSSASTYLNEFIATVVDGIATISATVTSSATIHYNSPGQLSSMSSGGGLTRTNIGTIAITAVPGPEAGAGLGALAMLGVAYWAKRRRDEKTIAA
jgi:hypothetical protein